MPAFRPVPETHHEEWRRILQYGFRPESGPPADPPDGEWPPSLYDQRGLYDDGDLRAVCKLYYLDAAVRGTTLTLGGLGAVATPPEHRRRGHATAICRHALAEYRESDVGFVALWPFSTPFYERLGWGTANARHRYELPPSALPRHDATGQMCPLSADDWERLRRVESAAAAGRSLSLRRSQAWWRERTLADWDGGGVPYCYGYDRDGTLAGYVVYTVADDGASTLSVTHLAAVDDEAHRALLAFLGTHGSRVERLRLTLPSDSALLYRVNDPEAVDCHVDPGAMVRLADVRALERLDWPDAALDGIISVSDPLLDRNDGLFRLSVSDGTAAVDSVSAADAADPVATVDIATLSQLAVGTHDVDAAERVAGLTVRDDSVRDSLSDVFRPETVYLDEFF